MNNMAMVINALLRQEELDPVQLLLDELGPAQPLLEELDPVHLIKNLTFPLCFQGFQRLHDHLVAIESAKCFNILVSKIFKNITS